VAVAVVEQARLVVTVYHLHLSPVLVVTVYLRQLQVLLLLVPVVVVVVY
jgi:hypothetical protein